MNKFLYVFLVVIGILLVCLSCILPFFLSTNIYIDIAVLFIMLFAGTGLLTVLSEV